MQDVIQGLADQRARTIQDTIRRICFDLARTIDPFAQDSQVQDAEDEDEDDEMEDYDEDLEFTFGASVTQSKHVDAERLQQYDCCSKLFHAF